MIRYWMLIASFTLNNGEKLETQVAVGNERECVVHPAFHGEIPFQGHDERQRMQPTEIYCRFVGLGPKPWPNPAWEGKDFYQFPSNYPNMWREGIAEWVPMRELKVPPIDRYRFDFNDTKPGSGGGWLKRVMK